MGPLGHSAISAIAATGVYTVTDSWASALLCFASGTLVDLDHILDYLLNIGTRGFSLKAVHAASMETGASRGERGMRRFYLIFHSAELLIGALCALFFVRTPLLIGFVVGYGLHLVVDWVTNPVIPQTYFILWRASIGFRSNRFHTDKALISRRKRPVR